MPGISEEDFCKGLLVALKNPSIKEELTDIISTSLKNEIVSLRKELKEKDSVIEDLKEQIVTLETETDNLQQYSRRNSIRITGITETEYEDPVERSLALFNETLEVQPPIQISDVDRIHRVGPKAPMKSRQMLVKFSTYLARKRVMDARKSLENSSIWLNEDLTRRRSHICWMARTMKKEKKIQGVWTVDGNILVKNNVNRVVMISSIHDLEQEAMIPRPPENPIPRPPENPIAATSDSG